MIVPVVEEIEGCGDPVDESKGCDVCPEVSAGMEHPPKERGAGSAGSSTHVARVIVLAEP